VFFVSTYIGGFRSSPSQRLSWRRGGQRPGSSAASYVDAISVAASSAEDIVVSALVEVPIIQRLEERAWLSNSRQARFVTSRVSPSHDGGGALSSSI
jgi:hypothetical protein